MGGAGKQACTKCDGMSPALGRPRFSFTHAGVVAMSYVIEFTPEGTVAKLTCETVAELQAILGSLGRPAASGMRVVRPRRTKRRPAKRKAAASAGWTPEVYKLAKRRKIKPTEARKIIAAEKREKAKAG